MGSATRRRRLSFILRPSKHLDINPIPQPDPVQTKPVTHLRHRGRSGSFFPPPSPRRHDILIAALLRRLELEAITARHCIPGPLSVRTSPDPLHDSAAPHSELVQRVDESARRRQGGRVQVVRRHRQPRQVERREVRLTPPQGIHVQSVGVDEELRRTLLLGRLGGKQPAGHRAQLLQDLGHGVRSVSDGRTSLRRPGDPASGQSRPSGAAALTAHLPTNLAR